MPEDSSRILVIDDEPAIRQVLDRILSSRYKILALPSSRDLEQALEQFQPNLIILDVNLPEENGWLICSRLRQDKRFDSIPVVFLSAMGDEASVREGYASGGDYYLSKPFDVEVLQHAVEAFVGRKHHHPNEVT